MNIALSVQRYKYSIFGTDFNCQSSLFREEGGYQISQAKIESSISAKIGTQTSIQYPRLNGISDKFQTLKQSHSH